MSQESSSLVTEFLRSVVGPRYNRTTGRILHAGYPYERSAAINFSELSGIPIDNLIAGIFIVAHPKYGELIVSHNEASALVDSGLGWAITASAKGL